MSKPAPQPDPQDAQTDLLATLAASRELGPEMDKALVESYMQKHVSPTPAPQNQQGDLPARFNSSDLASAIVTVVGIAAVATLVLIKGPLVFPLVWIFLVFGGWRLFGRSHRNAEYRARREEYRQARRQMRDEWRARAARGYYYRRGDTEFYYRSGDAERRDDAVPPTPPQVNAPQPPAQPTAAPLPPTAQAPVAPPVPPTQPAPSSTGGMTPPVNPAG